MDDSTTPDHLQNTSDILQVVHRRSASPPGKGPNDMPTPTSTPTDPFVRGRPLRRRCASFAEASNKARTWFSSPDRFLSPRAESVDRGTVFRVSKAPQNLSPRERSTRQRDTIASPFHSPTTSRSREAVRRQRSPSGRQHPPHFTPSFVHGHDALPGTIDAAEPTEPPRQISLGAVWSVGGSTVARGGPRVSIPDGQGGLLASGTTSPIYTAHFLDRGSPNQDAQRQEDRIALALEIDQASRVLGPSLRPPLLKTPSTESPPQSRPFEWKNNTWSREDGTDRESRRLHSCSIY
jgi:hypothetical protein